MSKITVMEVLTQVEISLENITDQFVGRRIYKARQIANMGPKQLAEQIGETSATIHSMERGQRITAIRLLKIAKATGQKLTFFLGEEGTTDPKLGTLNFRPGRRGAHPQVNFGDLLIGCVGGGDGRIRTAE